MKWFYGIVLNGPESYIFKTKSPKDNSYALLMDAKKDLCMMLARENILIEDKKREIWAIKAKDLKEI